MSMLIAPLGAKTAHKLPVKAAEARLRRLPRTAGEQDAARIADVAAHQLSGKRVPGLKSSMPALCLVRDPASGHEAAGIRAAEQSAVGLGR
jgi:hypothetical protein